MDYLKALSWEKASIKFTPESIAPRDLKIIIGLFQTYILKEQSPYSCMRDGQERFKEYIQSSFNFPKPVILERASDDKYFILDGYHRITAYFYLFGFFNIKNAETPNLNVHEEQMFWIANK